MNEITQFCENKMFDLIPVSLSKTLPTKWLDVVVHEMSNGRQLMGIGHGYNLAVVNGKAKCKKKKKGLGYLML